MPGTIRWQASSHKDKTAWYARRVCPPCRSQPAGDYSHEVTPIFRHDSPAGQLPQRQDSVARASGVSPVGASLLAIMCMR